ncbi:MAG: DUF559 domain-containing protein, partial [Nanoarchaeota archaeon]
AYKEGRKTPKRNTSIEVKMQNELTKRNIIFSTNKLIDNINKKYHCDIFIEPNIVVECDGDYWHNLPNKKETDKIRTKEMQEKGYVVFRFWESEINNNVELCVSEIQEFLDRSVKYFEFNMGVKIC